MAYSFQAVVQNEITNFLKNNGIIGNISDEEVLNHILEGSMYYEFPVEGKRLVLFRFYSPVCMREEVFMGSVLLNSFLSRNILLAGKENDLGPISMVANDIENFYYLWFTDKTIEELKEAYLSTLEDNLEDLYFSDRNEEKGIYGEFKKLLEFHKNNIEAFPIFAIPRIYVNKLGTIARQHLRKRIEEFDFQSNPTKITANMSFFLSRDGGEFQSPYILLAQTVNAYKKDTGLDEKELKQALNLDSVYDTSNKKGLKTFAEDIKDSMSKEKYSPDKLKRFFIKTLDAYEKLASINPDEWNMKYAKEKALSLKPQETVKELLNRTQMGLIIFNDKRESDCKTFCRCCGANGARLTENHIIMGEDVGKFHNQIVNKDVKNEIKICIKCCIQSYLITKLVGNTAGSLAFVPQQGSMIFHYGRHDDNEVKTIADSLKKSLSLIKQQKEARFSLAKINSDMKDLLKKLESASEKKRHELQMQKTELERLAEEKTRLNEIITNNLREFLNNMVDPVSDPAIDILYESDIDIDAAENYVFSIGLGDYRLMLFILPEFKNTVNKKAHNYIQERFNNSRITVLTLLAFLRKLCGCDGPYYYMTLPSLDQANFSTDTFYVRDEKYSADEVINYYEVFAGFSKKVVRWDEDKRFIKKMILTESMVDEPMITLSEVMRHSKVLSFEGEDKYDVIFDGINRQPNLAEYFNLFLKCKEYQTVKRGR